MSKTRTYRAVEKLARGCYLILMGMMVPTVVVGPIVLMWVALPTVWAAPLSVFWFCAMVLFSSIVWMMDHPEE